MYAVHTVRQGRRPRSTGDTIHPLGKKRIDPTQNTVLFVDHPRAPQQPRRAQRGNRRVAPKTHDHIGLVSQHPARHGQHAAEHTQRHQRLGQQPAPREGGAAHLFDLGRMGKATRIARATRVSGQFHTPAPAQHDLGQRLRRKHVTAGPSGCDDKIGFAHGFPAQGLRHRDLSRPRLSTKPDAIAPIYGP